jgi:hypothetical protein
VRRYRPEQVIPAELGAAVRDLPYWFVIGGQAVRCFCPYRPSRDVDFGVGNAADLEDFVAQLAARGPTEILERSPDTVHLRWGDIEVSVFLLDRLVGHTEERRLTVEGILATKLHAILDRGTRRDFFDLYVTLQLHQRGIADCLVAIRAVYRQEVNDALLLRALTYFDDAEREARLPGEGAQDWRTVKDFFLKRVGQLLVPPARPLAIQRRIIDVV